MIKRIIITTLLLSLIFGKSILSHLNDVAAKSRIEEELSALKYDDIIETSNAYLENYNESNGYYGVYNYWLGLNIPSPLEIYTITSEDVTGGNIVAIEDSFGYDKSTVEVNPTETITFSVDVEHEGLYEFYIDNYLKEETLLRPSLSVSINGLVQYNEMYNLELPMKWEINNEKSFDRFGDEITPNSYLKNEWSNFGLTDPNYFFVEPIKFFLNEGVNEISILVNEGYILFGDISIGNIYIDAPTYSEYSSSVSSNPKASGLLTIPAEGYTYESKQNIRAKFERDPNLTPYSYKNRVLNVLDQSSFRKSGDSVTYTFDVAEAGLYNISLKYLQSQNEGLATSRLIKIDGEIPFES